MRHAREVLAHQRVLAFLIDLGEACVKAPARVVDDPNNGCRKSTDPRVHGLAVTYVENRRMGTAPLRLDRGHGLGEQRLFAIAHGNVGAKAGTRDRRRRAYTLRRARYYD